jgi:hypothetical protein
MTAFRKIAAIFRRKPGRPACDACAFVDYFRSNGDGQATRLQAFCRCPGGPFEDRPIPRERFCPRWEQAKTPVARPRVGDSSLTV